MTTPGQGIPKINTVEHPKTLPTTPEVPNSQTLYPKQLSASSGLSVSAWLFKAEKRLNAESPNPVAYPPPSSLDPKTQGSESLYIPGVLFFLLAIFVGLLDLCLLNFLARKPQRPQETLQPHLSLQLEPPKPPPPPKP